MRITTLIALTLALCILNSGCNSEPSISEISNTPQDPQTQQDPYISFKEIIAETTTGQFKKHWMRNTHDCRLGDYFNFITKGGSRDYATITGWRINDWGTLKIVGYDNPRAKDKVFIRTECSVELINHNFDPSVSLGSITLLETHEFPGGDYCKEFRFTLYSLDGSWVVTKFERSDLTRNEKTPRTLTMETGSSEEHYLRKVIWDLGLSTYENR